MACRQGAAEETPRYVPSGRHTSPLDPKSFWILLRKTISKWNDDPTLQFGSALAYYTAFAVVPLLFIVVELAAVFFGRSHAEGLLFEHVEQIMGEQGKQAVSHLLDTWEQVGVGGLVIVLEAVLMFVALAGVFNQLQDALNYIWGVEPKPRDGLFSRVRRRFLSILGVLGTAFLLLVSLVLTALFTAGGQAVLAHVPGPETVNQFVFRGISFIAVTVIFAMIFKLLPQAKVAWADVWVGAAVTAILFSVGRLLILYYLGQTLVVSLYGSAAPLVIILLWAYYSSQILLFGAEFTAVYASECGSRLVPTDDAVAVREPAKTNEALQQSRGKQRSVSTESREHTGRRDALARIRGAEKKRSRSGT